MHCQSYATDTNLFQNHSINPRKEYIHNNLVFDVMNCTDTEIGKQIRDMVKKRVRFHLEQLKHNEHRVKQFDHFVAVMVNTYKVS